MTDDILEPRLGAGKIIAESFSLLLRNVGSVVLLCFPISLLGLLIVDYIEQPLNTGNLFDDGENIFVDGVNIELWVIAQDLAAFVVDDLLALGIATALVTQLAYDAKLDRPISFKQYYSRTFATLFQNVVLSFGIIFVLVLGIFALVVPGLWLFGVLSVVIPALVIERAGFGALRRSIDLTKKYRWPIVCVVVLITICGSFLDVAGEYLGMSIATALGANGGFISTAILALAYSLSIGLISISSALIYARLREIKDGIGLEDLASVFE